MNRIHNIMNLQKNVFDKKFTSLMTNVNNYVTDNHNDRSVNYLLAIHRKINEVITDIDELNLDININSTNNLSPEIIEDMKNYVIDEKVKEKFLPYMYVYRTILEQEYHN